MSQDPFETDLERLFAEVPEAPDAEAFAVGLETRLGARGRFRAWALAGSGALGVAVAAPQLISMLPGAAGLWRALGPEAAMRAVQNTVSQGRFDLDAVASLVHAAPGGSSALWVALGLVALAAGAVKQVLQEA